MDQRSGEVKDEEKEYVLKVAHYLLDKINKQLEEAISQNEIGAIVKAIVGAQKVHIYGMGRSGLMGKAFAMRLAHLGFNVVVLDETITYPVLPSDTVILISGSGKTSSIIRMAEVVKKIGAKIVAVTSDENSDLAKLSDIVVKIPIKEDRMKSKYAPMGTLFEDSVMIFFDSLIAYMMALLGETEKEMMSRHASLERSP